MIYIQHRCNSAQSLTNVHKDFGVEIDLRSVVGSPGALHLAHDPWVLGENFDQWLNTYAQCKIQGPLILNTKEDGLEAAVIEALNKHQIENYFFLDTALPTLVKWSVNNRFAKFAVRHSAYEPIEFCRKFAGLVEWVWVDCFALNPMPPEAVLELGKKFKTCLVSPELQGGNLELIETFAQLYPRHFNAICTKRPDLWMQTAVQSA